MMNAKGGNRRKKNYHKLEIGWDTSPVAIEDKWKSVSVPNFDSLKNILQRSEVKRAEIDIVSQSLPNKDSLTELLAPVQTKTAFDSIAQTFGFVHHEGSDRTKELKVLKTILLREGLLNRLIESCAALNSGSDGGDVQYDFLNMMTTLREHTCTLVEQVSDWRTSMPNVEAGMPRPFLFRGQNYMLKMISDLDFLATVKPLVLALGIAPSKMCVNPLMLPNSLAELDSRAKPNKMATRDVNGAMSGPLFDERLRLRKAERALLQECEFNMHGTPSIDWDEDYRNFLNDRGSASGSYDMDPEGIHMRKRSLLTWSVEARVQLEQLERKLGERLTSASTRRLDVPSSRGQSPFKVRFFHSTPDLAPPVKLTSLTSDQCTVETTEDFLGSGSGSHSSASQRGKALPLRKRLGLPDSSVSQSQRSPTKANSSPVSASRIAPLPVSDMRRSHSAVSELPAMPEVPTEEDASPRAGESSRVGLEEILPEDLQAVLDIDPPDALRLCSASIMVLLASSLQSAADLTWDAFVAYCGGGGGGGGDSQATVWRVADCMNALVPADISVIKIEAIRPSARSLQTANLSEGLSRPLGFEVECSVMKLVNWVIKVVANASLFRKASKPAKAEAPVDKKPDPLPGSKKVAKTAKKGAKPLDRATADPQPRAGPVPVAEMDTKLTEVAEGLYVRPLVVVLLASRTTPTNRLIFTAFDPYTSNESRAVVNVREYQMLLYGWETRFEWDPRVSRAFEPASVDWWIAHYRRVLKIREVSSGTFKLTISKKAIEQLVLDAMNEGADGKRAQAEPEPEPEERQVAASQAWSFHTEQEPTNDVAKKPNVANKGKAVEKDPAKENPKKLLKAITRPVGREVALNVSKKSKKEPSKLSVKEEDSTEALIVAAEEAGTEALISRAIVEASSNPRKEKRDKKANNPRSERGEGVVAATRLAGQAQARRSSASRSSGPKAKAPAPPAPAPSTTGYASTTGSSTEPAPTEPAGLQVEGEAVTAVGAGVEESSVGGVVPGPDLREPSVSSASIREALYEADTFALDRDSMSEIELVKGGEAFPEDGPEPVAAHGLRSGGSSVAEDGSRQKAVTVEASADPATATASGAVGDRHEPSTSDDSLMSLGTAPSKAATRSVVREPLEPSSSSGPSLYELSASAKESLRRDQGSTYSTDLSFQRAEQEVARTEAELRAMEAGSTGSEVLETESKRTLTDEEAAREEEEREHEEFEAMQRELARLKEGHAVRVGALATSHHAQQPDEEYGYDSFDDEHKETEHKAEKRHVETSHVEAGSVAHFATSASVSSVVSASSLHHSDAGSGRVGEKSGEADSFGTKAGTVPDEQPKGTADEDKHELDVTAPAPEAHTVVAAVSTSASVSSVVSASSSLHHSDAGSGRGSTHGEKSGEADSSGTKAGTAPSTEPKGIEDEYADEGFDESVPAPVGHTAASVASAASSSQSLYEISSQGSISESKHGGKKSGEADSSGNKAGTVHAVQSKGTADEYDDEAFDESSVGAISKPDDEEYEDAFEDTTSTPTRTHTHTHTDTHPHSHNQNHKSNHNDDEDDNSYEDEFED